MLSESTSTTSTKVKTMPDGTTETKTFTLTYSSGELKVLEHKLNEQQETEEILIIVQPWKCLPDGTRDNFDSYEDAFQWFEDSKSWLV